MDPTHSAYSYIWEYEVRPECIEAFENHYGPDGEWVRLFRRAEGYIRTELHRDRQNPQRYVTIDYWVSSEAWDSFRSEYAKDFDDLDARCGLLTSHERELGRFVPIKA